MSIFRGGPQCTAPIQRIGVGEGVIRQCARQDHDTMLAIINAAASIYQGSIPPECWHDPYMTSAELASEIAGGVHFIGFETGSKLLGIMGMQHRGEVDLIRHAYVLPDRQGHGIGTKLLTHLRNETRRTVLVGTWKAAGWAIAFYKTHGFEKIEDRIVEPLLRSYWNVSEAQTANSVVLSSPALRRRPQFGNGDWL